MPRPGLILMAKAPVRGRVKTRLAADLGEAEALRIYCRLLDNARSVARRWANDHGGVYGWWVTGDGAAEWAESYDPAADHVGMQRGNDLGERMARAFADAFDRGWGPVVMAGCDVPGLTPGHLRRAVDKLASHPVVIAPAADGGYVLIGLNSLVTKPFSGPDWGTDRVFQQTRRILEVAEIDFHVLPSLSDIDTAEDLVGQQWLKRRPAAD